MSMEVKVDPSAMKDLVTKAIFDGMTAGSRAPRTTLSIASPARSSNRTKPSRPR